MKPIIDLRKLYKTLVVGGAMLSLGCTPATKQTGSKEAAKEAAKEQPAKTKCSDICRTENTGERFCPDPQTGTENCCWLMSSANQPCCDTPIPPPGN